MPLLGFLSFLERERLVGEIGTRILQVLVQEAAIEIRRMIIMMMHVAARAFWRIDDRGKTRQLLQPPFQRAGPRIGGQLLVDQQQVEKVRKLSLGDRQCAVHIGPPYVQGGMKRKAAVKAWVVEANRGCRKSATCPEFVPPACMVDNA